MSDKPHPLALALAEHTQAQAKSSEAPNRSRFVLILGGGSGRNIPPLLAAGMKVDIVEQDPARAQHLRERFNADSRVHIAQGSHEQLPLFQRRYVGMLSTHALLHQTRQRTHETLQTFAEIAVPNAHVLFTLGSVHDPRFGQGRRIDSQTWVPLDGPEIGVAHTYYNEEAARALLRSYEIISLQETHAREIVGEWAHDPRQTPDIVHWYAHALLRPRRSAPDKPLKRA